MTKGLMPFVGLTLSVLFLVAGCAKPAPRAVYTVNYYRTHEDFRLAKLKECANGPAESTDPDCLNASRANMSETKTAAAN
jgi:hypothetical protein